MQQPLPREHPGAEPPGDEVQDPTVTDPLSQHREQQAVVERVEEPADVGIDHPPVAATHPTPDAFSGLVGRALRAEPERDGREVGFPDGLEDQLDRRLAHPVADGRDAEVALASRALGDAHAADGKRTVAALGEFS
jgi:hypothetical protein